MYEREGTHTHGRSNSRPDSGRAFQVEVLKTVHVVPSSLSRGPPAVSGRRSKALQGYLAHKKLLGGIRNCWKGGRDPWARLRSSLSRGPPAVSGRRSEALQGYLAHNCSEGGRDPWARPASAMTSRSRARPFPPGPEPEPEAPLADAEDVSARGAFACQRETSLLTTYAIIEMIWWTGLAP